jgi:hypothetical protein
VSFFLTVIHYITMPYDLARQLESLQRKLNPALTQQEQVA